MLTLRRCGLAFVTIVAAAGVCAPGCARRDASVAPATMRIGVGAPQNTGRGSGATFVIEALTTETWMSMLPDGRQGERIVTKWAWDDSGTVLTLTFRPDVFFHDGTHLTPDVAVEALRKSISDGVFPSYSSIRSITASGDDAVRLELSEPNAFLLPDLSLTSVKLPSNDKVGTGPFQIEAQSAQQTVLKAFPKSYRGMPRLGKIDVSVYPTQRNAWAALMRGDVDMLHEVSRDAVEFVEAETTVNTFSFPRSYYIPLVFNIRHPILMRADVRIGINQALNRAALIKDGLRGRGEAADGPIWPQHWAYLGGAQDFVFGRKAAGARLDGAGFVLKPGVEGTPKRFSFSCLMFADDTRFDRLAVLVQKQLAEVGIDMKLVPLPQRELVRRLGQGDFDAFIFEMAGRSLSWTYQFWRSNAGPNNSGYVAADSVLDRIRAARSEEEVRRGVAELTTVLHEDPPAAFLVWQQTSRAVATRFDVAAEKNRDIFTSIWQWGPALRPQKLTSP